MFQAPLGKNNNPKAAATKAINVGNYQGYREMRWKFSRWPAVLAQGSIALSGQPLNNESFVVGNKTYTFQTTLTNVDGNIAIGASLAITQQNIIDAINLNTTTGGPGTQYAAAMTEHSQVSATSSWVANVLVLTAKTGGVAGNLLTFTEAVTNMTMDGSGSFGGTRAGVDETDCDSIGAPYSIFGISNVSFDLYSLFRNYWNDNAGGDDLNAPQMNFPGTSRLMAANTFRKIVMPDWFGRRYKSIRRITPRIFTAYNSVIPLVAPYTASTSHVVIKSIQIDSSRIAIMYNQVSGTVGTYLVVCTINADYSLTPGTPVLIDATNAGLDAAFDMCLVNTDKVLISFRQSAATNFAATRVASLSGTTITMNALVQIAATALVESSVCKLATDKALIAWTNGTLVSYQVVTITGTVPSYGTAVTITGSPVNTNLVANGTDKAQAFYGKSSEARTVAVQISGTTVSLGSETTIQKQNNFSRFYHDAVQVATDKFVWLWTGYDLNNNGDYRNGAFITVSTLTSTVAQNVTMGNRQNNGNPDVTSGIMTSTAGSEYYWTSGQGTGSMSKAFSVDTVGNTISLPKSGNTEYSASGLGWWRNFFRDDFNNNYNFNRSERWVQVGTKTYAIWFDAYGGLMRCFGSDKVSLSLYNGETLLATITTQYPGIIEAVDVNAVPLSETAYLKIKNNNAFAISMEIPMIYLELE